MAKTKKSVEDLYWRYAFLAFAVAIISASVAVVGTFWEIFHG